MTTIVASAADGIMVCDSRMQTESMWWPCEKVYRVGDALIGGAGASASVTRFVEWYRARSKRKPKIDDDFVALVLDASGLWYWSCTMIPDKVDRGFHAIGTGGHAAIGALMAGASCHDAVQIACRIDTNSGGDIITHKLATT